MQYQKGFTLLEVLLVLGTLAIIAGISVPLALGYQAKYSAGRVETELGQTLRRAQTYARAMYYDSEWGVRVNGGEVVLFQGLTYLDRNPDFDERYDIPRSVTVDGLEEVVFAKLSGQPDITGTFQISAESGDQKQVEVNEVGMVEY